MAGKFLMWGMVLGLAAGLLAFGFATIFGEPQVDRAIAFEAQMEAAETHAAHEVEDASAHHHVSDMAGMAAHDHGDEELVSRPVQSTAGLLTGTLVYGAAMGGLFALVMAFAAGRLGRLGLRETSGLLALAGFVAIVLIPFLKYPASPPAVGNPGTIGPRTAWFFAMMAISLGAMVNAFVLARKSLVPHFGAWNGVLLAGLGYGVIVAVAMLLLPPVEEVPANFSATVLWQFRVASLGIHVVLWAVLGLGFGPLIQRRLHPATRAVYR